MVNRIETLALRCLLLVVLGIVLAACSGTADDASGAPPSTATSVAAETPAPVPTTAAQTIPTSAPEAISTPVQTATVIASTPTPSPVLAEMERLSEKGMELLTEFTEDYSPRLSGSSQEAVAARFIGEYLEDLGYRVEFQPLEVEYLPWDDRFVVLAGEDRPELQALPMSQTGFGDVIAPIVHVGRAFEEDIPADGLEGAIALIERGQITFEEKVNRVADAGAVAAIVYNNEQGNFRGALQSDGRIPAVSLSREQGEEVLRILEDEPELEARFRVEISLLDSQNVIAELDGQPGECGVVVMGAHYDSVAGTEAAGDNGTGVVSLLAMAEELADRQGAGEDALPHAVRFVFFGVEEIGLYGSKHYVDNLSEGERQDVIAMLNFDAMGKGDASVVGSAELVESAVEYAGLHGIELNRSNEPARLGSDHAAFLEVDIPALFFFGDDFSIINSPDDVLEEVEPSIMGTNMAVGMGVLQQLECKMGG